MYKGLCVTGCYAIIFMFPAVGSTALLSPGRAVPLQDESEIKCVQCLHFVCIVVFVNLPLLETDAMPFVSGTRTSVMSSYLPMIARKEFAYALVYMLDFLPFFQEAIISRVLVILIFSSYPAFVIF
jgi:hypothetical protein